MIRVSNLVLESLRFNSLLPDILFTGKSNLMDAISFVLGEKTQNLRVRRLSVSILLHGTFISKSFFEQCILTLKVPTKNDLLIGKWSAADVCKHHQLSIAGTV